MQPTKMQIFKSFFNTSDRRPQPPPIVVPPNTSDAGMVGADAMTPPPRPGTSACDHATRPGGFYQHLSMASSQPDLHATRRLQPSLVTPLTALSQGMVAPRKQSLGAVGAQGRTRLPAPVPALEQVPERQLPPPPKGSQAHTEDLDEVTSLPQRFGHRRGGGSQDATSSYAVAPDYSSSVASGILSRGPSTNSTSRSEMAVDFRRQSLEACSVQQDFFLEGLALGPRQRAQLVVSLPDALVAAYCSLYETPWATAPAALTWPIVQPLGLREERLMGASRQEMDGKSQLDILHASQAILKTPAGEQRLCRFLRWLLHSEAEDTHAWSPDELFEVPALTSREVCALLEPLGLTFAQQKRLDKHCRFIPHRLEASRGFASPLSYRGFH